VIRKFDLSALRSHRTTVARIAILLNIDMLLDCARAEGREPSFWTFTYATVGEFKEMKQDWSTFLRRLLKKVPLAGVRVFELGKTTKRFHVHAIFDRRVPIPDVESCKEGLMLGHSNVRAVNDANLARYLYKEFNKQIGRKDIPGRRWACFGELANCPWITMNSMDFKLPWAKERIQAIWTKEVGEPMREVMLRAFKDWLNSRNPGIAKLKNGELYITNVFVTDPEHPTLGLPAPMEVNLHIVDPEIAALLPEGHPDRELDHFYAYSFPNPEHPKYKTKSIPLK
jgi:hypothetical protein